INLKKCEFLVIEVKYLRLIITTKGIYINPKKVRIITKYFANFYRRFIYNYLDIA
ncbi:uncharacterized protein K441DRAFT_554006, partial [Cenococcum geophilum 1.58]|uniref:uncharacterized protein n=1 Tax=Cenococcum geophilum 1.58 TaxID=794803 RepID=UPI00358FE8BE